MEKIQPEELGGQNAEDVAFGRKRFDVRPGRNPEEDPIQQKDEYPLWAEARRELMDLPNHVGELNLDRIESFTRNWGLIMQDIVVCKRSDYEELKKKRPDLEDFLRLEEGIQGLALSEENLCLAVVDDFEFKEDLEAIVIYELAHANGVLEYGKKENEEDEPLANKKGFRQFFPDPDLDTGAFFEEGFAELMASYFREGFYSDSDAEEEIVIEKLTGEKSRIPAKFTNFDGGISVSAGPAYALELLIKEKPELIEALLEGRRDEEAFEKIRLIINEVSPGLYEYLQKLKNNVKDFRKGLYKVQNILKKMKK